MMNNSRGKEHEKNYFSFEKKCKNWIFFFFYKYAGNKKQYRTHKCKGKNVISLNAKG